jgi:hypothetical protein
MNDTPLPEAMEQEGWCQQVDALSVSRAVEHIQDGRHKRGVRSRVAWIVTLIVRRTLAGMTSLAGRVEGVRLRTEWLSEVMPHTHKSFPCAATESKVIRTVDAEQVIQVINDLLTRVGATKRWGDEPSRLVEQREQQEHVHVALAGKTLGGPLGHAAADQGKMHQLTLDETQTG